MAEYKVVLAGATLQHHVGDVTDDKGDVVGEDRRSVLHDEGDIVSTEGENRLSNAVIEQLKDKEDHIHSLLAPVSGTKKAKEDE